MIAIGGKPRVFELKKARFKLSGAGCAPKVINTGRELDTIISKPISTWGGWVIPIIKSVTQ